MKRRGFILLEVVLAVSIFALGILAIAKSADHCLEAQILVAQSQRARQAMENRMAQILAGEIKVGDEREDALKGIFEGIRLRQKRETLKFQNENKENLDGLYEVSLTAEWGTGVWKQTSRIVFYQMEAP